MNSTPGDSSPVVVVTGANGFVGSHLCAALVDRGATVRAVVRRVGTAPAGVEEHVGEFDDPAFATGQRATPTSSAWSMSPPRRSTTDRPKSATWTRTRHSWATTPTRTP